jgi:hypothetical protein
MKRFAGGFALLLWLCNGQAGAAFITNGDFETGDFAGWTKSDSSIDIVSNFHRTIPQDTGIYQAIFKTGSDAALSQTLGVTAPGDFVLSFDLWYSGVSDTAAEVQVLVSGNPAPVFDLMPSVVDTAGTSAGKFIHYTANFSAGASPTLTFQAKSSANYFVLDNVQVDAAPASATPAPAPPGFVLLASGAASALGLRQIRRRSAAA